jgi:hypothetical protein
MILTRRFGALAARRTFPHIDQMEQESISDRPSAEAQAERESVTADAEARCVA